MTDKEFEDYIEKEGKKLFYYLKKRGKDPYGASLIAALGIIYVMTNSNASEASCLENLSTIFNSISTDIKRHFASSKNKIVH